MSCTSADSGVSFGPVAGSEDSECVSGDSVASLGCRRCCCCANQVSGLSITVIQDSDGPTSVADCRNSERSAAVLDRVVGSDSVVSRNVRGIPGGPVIGMTIGVPQYVSCPLNT